MTVGKSAAPYDGRMGHRADTAAGRRRIRGIAAALVVDAALVAMFALTGRASHVEGLDPAGVWGTAWPFLAGLVVGWLVTRVWRHPLAPWPSGVLIWAATLIVGMMLRVASGQGVALAFVIVAAASLALLLVGWRAIATLVGRLSRRSSRAESSATPRIR